MCCLPLLGVVHGWAELEGNVFFNALEFFLWQEIDSRLKSLRQIYQTLRLPFFTTIDQVVFVHPMSELLSCDLYLPLTVCAMIYKDQSPSVV